MHMIFVTRQTVLARQVAGVTGLAEILLHRTETGREILRIALFVALQIRAAFLKLMAGGTTAFLQNAEMRLMDEVREASLFALGRGLGEIDGASFARDVINAMAFRARALSVLARE